MRATTWQLREPTDEIERARPRLIARRLPIFAAGWLITALAWGAVLVLDSRLGLLPAASLFIFQFGVLAIAIAICHSGGSVARAPMIALAACVLLALSSTSLFAVIGGQAEMLAFVLLTLLLASSPLFAWSGRAAAVLVFSTLVPWIVAIPFLRFFMRPLDLASAIAVSAVVSLLVLEASRRNVRLALYEAASHATYRRLADKAPDLIFTIDLEGRFTYVNEALARRLGVGRPELLGWPWHAQLTQNAQNGDVQEVIERVASGAELPATLWEVQSPDGPRWLEALTTAMRDQDGGVVGIHVAARDVTERLRAESGRAPTEDLAFLREVRTLEDEEVDHLRFEARRLRSQVAERLDEVNRAEGAVRADGRRRRPAPADASAEGAQAPRSKDDAGSVDQRPHPRGRRGRAPSAPRPRDADQT